MQRRNALGKVFWRGGEMKKVSELDIDMLDKAIKCIECTFVWKDTREGEKYWEKVRDNLICIREHLKIWIEKGEAEK